MKNQSLNVPTVDEWAEIYEKLTDLKLLGSVQRCLFWDKNQMNILLAQK